MTYVTIPPSGDVNGPDSSTDTAIARFNGTTGKILKDSSVLISDAGVMTGVSIVVSGSTANTAAVFNGSKALISSATTSTEVGYLSGVTSAIQTQINGKQATGNYVTALTGDVTAAGPGSVAATVAQIQGTVVSGTTGSTNVAFSASPTFSGTVTTANLSANASAAATVTIGGASSTVTHQINGGVKQTVRSTSSSFTVDTTTADYIILMDSSGGAKNITLPAPTAGRILIIKDSTGSFETNNVTLVRNGSEQIEGIAASKALQTAWGSYTITSDGTNWWFI